MKSVCDPETIAELGVTSAQFEYVLDAKTCEMISLICDYTLDDGTAFGSVIEVTYDTEEPEMVKTFMGYDNQTENLRNITVVSNPGIGNEKIESVQVPKGLVIGFRYDEDDTSEFHLYIDAACTEPYDPYMNTDSNLTVYVQWVEQTK
jgi:predicted small secreted protein